MGVLSKIPSKKILDRLANESGLAIVVVDENSREIFASNNNSICRHLNPSGSFSPECSTFCGRALEKAFEAGKAIGFECHAGLKCRAVPIGKPDKRLVAIVGRTFVKAENYRKATERAIAGDWSEFPPSEFFENILLTRSKAILDKTTKQFEGLVSEPEKAPSEPAKIRPATEPLKHSEPMADAGKQPAKKSPEAITNLVERFNREIGRQKPVIELIKPQQPEEPPVEQTPTPQPKPNKSDKRTAESRAWRSFFGSLLKTDYAKAVDSILQFLAHQYEFSTLIWLERKKNRFENTLTFGEMKNRTVRLGIAPDDRRLMQAWQDEMPLELGERSKKSPADSSRSMNLFPIGVGGEISAAIATLDVIEPESKKKQIARICHSIAPQLEILRLRSEVARRELIGGVVRRFSESLKHIDTDDFWLNLTQNAAEMLQAERASLLILDGRSGILRIKAMIGARSKFDADEAVGGRVARIVLKKNEPVLIPDVAKTGLSPAPAARKYKTPSFLSCPITIGGRSIGVMNFTDRANGKAFDKTSVELFQAIAPQLAVAIDRATLKDKAGEFEQLSVTDALTGLLNRRYIEERLMEEIKRSNRHGFPMSFMMLDVDQFKTYNDRFGHPAGDEALKIVGNVIRETLRGADVAARFGGEEFSILLPQTTSEEAIAIAERIRSNVEQAEFPHRKVTLSIGVASCSAELCSSANIVSAADKALYEAKRQGRNRVRAFEEMKKGRSQQANG